MEKENETRVSPGDESRVSFVRKRENSRFVSRRPPTFYLRMPRMRRRRPRLSSRRFNDRLPTIADNRFSISFPTYLVSYTSANAFVLRSFTRLELKFDRTSEEQLFIHKSLERRNDLYTIYTRDKFICEMFF